MKANTHPFKKLRLWSLAAVVFAMICPAGTAAVLSPLDQWPSEWSTIRSGAATEVEKVGDELFIRRPSDGNSTGAFTFWNGNETVPDGLFSDFSGSVILRYNNRPNDAWGVLIGAQSKTFTSSETTNNRGFYIGLLPNSASQNGGLYIWENLRTTQNSSASNALTGDNQWSGALPTNTDLLLEFSVTGATLQASLWNIDSETGQKTGNVLASVTYVNDEAITGYFGLGAFRLGGATSRSFSDLKLETIPEPNSVALGLVVLLGGLACRTLARRKTHL